MIWQKQKYSGEKPEYEAIVENSQKSPGKY